MKNKPVREGLLSPEIRSILGRILLGTAVTAGFFAWWLSMLLLASLFALNVWKPSFTSLLLWSGILTGISTVVWILIRVRRR